MNPTLSIRLIEFEQCLPTICQLFLEGLLAKTVQQLFLEGLTDWSNWKDRRIDRLIMEFEQSVSMNPTLSVRLIEFEQCLPAIVGRLLEDIVRILSIGC